MLPPRKVSCSFPLFSMRYVSVVVVDFPSLPVILDKANKLNVPVFGSEIEQVKIGCLAAMGLDYIDLGKQTGKMAAAVLKGEKKASEMDFEVIEEAAFYGNEKVAENLGITFPEDLTSSAKELFTEITE